jgi:uncharacterized protein (DUF2336 family)
MLSQVHVRALCENPSGAVRADVAVAVAAEIAERMLTPSERELALQILEILARDVDRRVRQALAEHVKGSPFLPRAIAATLAHDIEADVALPIIEHSPLLEDAELIALVRDGCADRRLAVARRRTLKEPVAAALVETGDTPAVGAVLANDGAEISAASLLRIARDFQGDPAIERLLVERAALPLGVVELMIAGLSRQLRDRLVERHRLPADLADELVALGRERALVEALPSCGPGAAERLAARLHAKRLLTPTLLLRALCTGDLEFFEAGAARLAALAAAPARELIYDRRRDGRRAIHRKAGLPEELLPAFRVGVDAVLDGRLAAGRAQFTQHVLEQLILAYHQLAPGGLEQVLDQLARWVAPRPRPAGSPAAAPWTDWAEGGCR